DGAAAQRWREQGLALWRQEVARARVDESDQAAPTVLGRLQAALDDVLVRDGVLLGLVPGADRVADRVVAGGGGDEVGQVLRAIIDPEVGSAPEQERTTAARAVLEAVVAHAPRRSQAPASTLLAVVAWWNGDGARASVLCERALEADEDHRLALLVHEALVQGMPPGWLRAAQRETG
ncbi:DUF4192 family protein, partial [Actinotalea sp. C106]|uniref:DUF4192 family protein n=1 Tax=Actinotalea sp. C106 TaxID=2908644 RepID=UPI00202798D8